MDTLLLKLSFHAFCFLFLLTATTSATILGVTYTSPLTPPSSSAAGNTSVLPPPPQLSHPEAIAYAVSTLGFRALRLSHPDPGIIRALAFTNVSLLISIENELLIPLASSRSVADDWLRVHVLPFYPRSTIAVISVGDGTVPILQSELLLPAIRNVDLALQDFGIKDISVTATLSFLDVVTGIIPPSLATFREPMGEQVIRPLLQFLEDHSSVLLVDLSPYKVSRMYSQIPLGFSLFQGGEQSFYRDFSTGLTYHNMFDLMVDAVANSLEIFGYEDMPLVVAAAGWPSSAVGEDGSADPDATRANAEAYLSSLVAHLKVTPERNQVMKQVYLEHLIDAETEQGTQIWGILDRNLSNKYPRTDFSSSAAASIQGMTKTPKKRMIPRDPVTVSDYFQGRPANWTWMAIWVYDSLLVVAIICVLFFVSAVLFLGLEVGIVVAIRGLFN
ncbi:unnamed protein product [Linum tenue]|uniref:glucan endo-1,3-beta-D-glucosidase n=1 Tax=Linum tenue TaxID=586396 RepID=A0AAV0MBB5_9ROSI|nr:unnamed protein product [Linum tenue]